jgi:hypothetical protein
MMIGGEPVVVKHIDPIFAPDIGDISSHAGRREGRWHGRAGLLTA